MQSEMWTAKETAAFLKVSTSWVYQHAADCSLPSVKIIGTRRFLSAQIKAFAAGQPIPPSNILSFPVDPGSR